MLTAIFWIMISIIVYAYIGYLILLFLLNSLKNLFFGNRSSQNHIDSCPEVSILIAAYNEQELVKEKMENTLALNYPKDKLQVVWVTDGSEDKTVEILKGYEHVTVLHQNHRKGKTAALNRAMKHITTPYTVFCDANTMLHKDAILNLLAPFSDPKVGCVAGEKRVYSSSFTPAGSGEGAYWKYESKLKKLESGLHSTIAAAGELYAIRTKLFTPVPNDTIVDDLVISLNIASARYQIKYQDSAYATEKPSANMSEEMKRKVRIAAGGIQTTIRHIELLNIFKYGFFSFQFLSHKVLRWLFVPLCIPLITILNTIICYRSDWQSSIFLLLLAVQSILYTLFIIGFILRNKNTRIKLIYYPYYLLMINYAQFLGLIRCFTHKQSAAWEKAAREK